MRGRIRGWLTLTSCAGVRFIKFRRLSPQADYITYLKDELPCRKTNLEYRYQYCDADVPEPVFIKWLQAVIAVRIEYPKYPDTLALFNVLEHVPKKINGKIKGLDGYGMYAVSSYSFWKALVALAVASLGPAIFMVRWLIGHHGDWQNALALMAVMLSLLNIIVLQHDRWSVYTGKQAA